MKHAIPLWPGTETELRNDPRTVDETGRIRNVSVPWVELIPPESGNGTALLVCPGGGYGLLAWAAHVARLAQCFNPHGIAVIGLGYRTRPPSTDVPVDALADLRCALSIVDERADEWGIDKGRVVGLGFSAGANLLLQHICTEDTQQDRITLRHLALLCLWPFNQAADTYGILPDAPDTVLFATEEDQTAPAEFSQAIAERLREAGGEAALTVYPEGDHLAFNFKKLLPDVDWTPDFLDWLRSKDVL